MSGKTFACRGIAEVPLEAHEVQVVASLSSAGLAQGALSSVREPGGLGGCTARGWLTEGWRSIYSSPGHALHFICPKLWADREAFGPLSPSLKQLG